MEFKTVLISIFAIVGKAAAEHARLTGLSITDDAWIRAIREGISQGVQHVI